MSAYCDRCERYFPHDRALEQHTQNSANHFTHECPACTLFFDYESHLDEHIKNDHFECDECGKICKTANGLQQHENIHTPQWDCDKCNASFWDEHALSQHEQVHIRSVKCRFCTRMFANHSAMVLHAEGGTCASGVDRHRINEYVRSADSNNIITRRLITYPGQEEYIATERSYDRRERMYRCGLCDKLFKGLQDLNRHLKSPVHEAKQYYCPKKNCQKEYTSLSGLVQHIEFGGCGFEVPVMRNFIDTIGTGRRLMY